VPTFADRGVWQNPMTVNLSFLDRSYYFLFQVAPHLSSKYNNDSNFNIYFKQYCKILSEVILAAKELHYIRIIVKSDDKIRSTWKVIN
jgi:hypothetical protein